MAYMPEYYRGQGRVFVAPIVGGQRGKVRWVGNVPELEIGVEVEKEEHKESYSGQSLVDLTLITETKTSFKTVIEEFTKENLALAFRASVATIAGAKINKELSDETIATGDVWLLNHIGVSELKMTDSSSTAVALEVGKHYELDEKFGRITLLNTEGLTAPLKAAYTYAKRTEIDMMQAAVEGYYVRFEGLNTAASNAPVLIEMLKVDIDPAKTLSLIQDELGNFELEGNVLAVDGKTVKITKL
ncbi:MAG: hypothetical protein ACRDCT_02260 [Shewanella sp.]